MKVQEKEKSRSLIFTLSLIPVYVTRHDPK